MSGNIAAYAVGAVAAVSVPAYFLVNKWAQGGVYRDNDARIDGKIVIITGWNMTSAWHFIFEGARPANDSQSVIIVIVWLSLGANTGIGRETALELAKRGGRIYLACRDLVKADGARLDIIHKSGNRNIFTKKLDLASFESIRQFVEEYVFVFGCAWLCKNGKLMAFVWNGLQHFS